MRRRNCWRRWKNDDVRCTIYDLRGPIYDFIYEALSPIYDFIYEALIPIYDFIYQSPITNHNTDLWPFKLLLVRNFIFFIFV